MSERPHDLTGRPLTLIPPLKINRKCVIKDVALPEVIVQDDASRQGSASSRELGKRYEISEEYEFQKMTELEKRFELERRFELEKRFEVEEELELQERLERYCHFFTDEPPMDEFPKRCSRDFERVHREWYDDLVFRRLRKDLMHAPEETGPTQYRSWAIVQEFWDNIRKSLSIEDSEISDTEPSSSVEDEAAEIVDGTGQPGSVRPADETSGSSRPCSWSRDHELGGSPEENK